MPIKPVTTWVLVADGAKARLLERIGVNAPLTPVPGKEFSESEARTPTRDIGADRPGRVQESANTARHAMEPRVDWHRYAKEQFAKSVAGALEQAALQKKYEALGQHARSLVADEIAKDLTNLPEHELPAHLA